MIPEVAAWHVAAWSCPACQAVNVIMDPAGDDDVECDDCGELAHVTGVDG